jgi:hypothetical protein
MILRMWIYFGENTSPKVKINNGTFFAFGNGFLI